MYSWLWPWGKHEERAPAAAPAAPVLHDAVAPVDGPPVESVHVKPEPIRLPFSTLFVISSYGLGFVSGMATGGQRAGLVFLAENAHRLPTTVQGWYFYNKTKNYRVILGGLRQGSWTGLRLSGWVSGWCLLDIMSQRGREWAREQFGRSATPPGSLDPWGLGHWTDGLAAGIAAAVVGAIACALLLTDRIPQPTVPRMIALGAVAGGATGGLRDMRCALLGTDDSY